MASTITPQKQEKVSLGSDERDAEPKNGSEAPAVDDDDLDKYPSRSEMAGGWAGGEVGLQQFIQVELLFRQLIKK